MSISRMLNIGESAIYAFRVGLEVTSNNIANADTPEYNRQRVILQSNLPPDTTSTGLNLGRGVTVAEIQSLRAKNLINDYHNEYSSVMDYQTRQPLLSEIEGLLNPDEDYGLSAVLEGYWDAWDDLANTPDGEAQRLAVVDQGQTLAAYFRTISNNLSNMARDMEANVNTAVNQINALSQQIAAINVQIRNAEWAGSPSGTFRDTRDSYLKELSGLVGNQYFEDTDGTVTVFLDNGKPLVQGEDYFTLDVQSTNPRAVTWSGDGADITSSLTGGKLGAWAEIMDSVIPQYQDNLDELANGIIWEVNRLHSQGVGLEPFESVTSDYIVSDPDAALASEESGLAFADKIESEGYFKIFVYDSSGNAVSHKIEVTDQTTLNDLAGAINALDNISATVTSGKLTISADSDYSFNFGEVTDYESETDPYNVNSSMLAALGINTFWKGSGASSFQVNDTVQSDHTKITAGFIAGVGEDDTPPVNAKTGEYTEGDNRNALAISMLRQTQVDLELTTYTLADGASAQTTTATLGEFLGTIVSQIGVMSNDATVNGDYHEMLATQIQSLVSSEGGVSMDEEMIELLKYQRAYQGAARVITTADEVLQTLIQL